MSKIYNGFIIQDTTPQAFALVESWQAKMAELNGRPEIELNDAIDAMQKQQQETMVAIARIEQAVNVNAGKVITS